MHMCIGHRQCILLKSVCRQPFYESKDQQRAREKKELIDEGDIKEILISSFHRLYEVVHEKCTDNSESDR